MPPTLTKTIDLQYMDRFDTESGALQIKINTTGVFFTGLGEKIPGRRVALYAGKPASSYLIIAATEDEKGYEIKASARGARCCCSRFVSALIERGVELPQTADLSWDDRAGAYVAELRLITTKGNGEEPPRRKGGRPQKGSWSCEQSRIRASCCGICATT